MIKITRWRPDTCECILEYSWDTDVPQEERTHTPTTHIPCEFHAHLQDVNEHHEIIKTENTTKNVVLHHVATSLGWKPEVIHPKKNIVTQGEQNAHLSPASLPWSFNNKREFQIHADVIEQIHDIPKQQIQDIVKSLPIGVSSIKVI